MLHTKTGNKIMSSITMTHFDVLEFVNIAKKNGINQEFAEYTARQFEQMTNIIQEKNIEIETIKNKELVQKGDLIETELRLKKGNYAG